MGPSLWGAQGTGCRREVTLVTLSMSLPATACVVWAHIRGKPRSLPTVCVLVSSPLLSRRAETWHPRGLE